MESCAKRLLRGGPFDLVFIDHAKERYLEDLRRIEALGALRSGSLVVADNVLCFGPLEEYLSYVRDAEGPFASSELHRSFVEYTHGLDEREADGVEVSVYR